MKKEAEKKEKKGHSDRVADEKLIREEVKPSALKKSAKKK